MAPESTEPSVESSTMRPTADASNVASSMNQRHSLSLRKARKLSRVLTEFSLLDPFASRKNADSSRTPPQHAGFVAHNRIHTRTISLETSSKKNHDGSPPSPTSPICQSPAREIKADTTPHDTLILNSEAPEELPQLCAPSTSQIRPPKSPKIPPLSRHTSRLSKKHRKSLDLRRTDGSPMLARSTSLRISDMRRPATHNRWRDSSPDFGVLPVLPEANNHYLEVKRARKMTQLLGQELPPELIRIPDNGRKAEHSRHRRNSLLSLESAQSTQETDDEGSFEVDVLDVTDKPSSKLPHEDFQKRRRRITKLTQFFGVSHSEIASSVMSAKPDDRTTSSLDAELQEYAPATIVGHGVGVKIVSRRRWGLGEDMRDVELSDAITRLRGLKST